MTDPKRTATTLARNLADRLADRLRSVLLYGSVARGEAVEGVSDINVLVLLDDIDARALEQCAPIARRWAEAGNTVPLLMAWDEWQRAADVFAIEMADMRDAHRVLHGDDPLAGLSIDSAELRLQAERELRGKLVQLREGMLLAAERPEEVGRLLLAALPSFTTYLRTALRLNGHDVPARTPDVVRASAALVGGDAEPFLRIWNARTEGRVPGAQIDEPIVTGYYALAEQTANWVDSLTDRGGAV